ncbi:DUF4177 domain-containing protein [Aestuariivita boseongensis]|uniref:DUF4177 domain-containing protein n=1 Tax=Aestuariivita boseongensis TaxID=1470562 RepID=UPI0009E654A0|nr:DUF4177 domain-containing protein [Aestuariivita boseongensis]
MPEFEYKVVPAPTKGAKAKGVKTPEARFAHAVETLMNELAGEGWEYVRADMLPSEERQGLTGSTTNWRNLLVFRRVRGGSLEVFAPREIAAPAPVSAEARRDPPPLQPVPVEGPRAEDISAGAGVTAGLRARAAAIKAAE